MFIAYYTFRWGFWAGAIGYDFKGTLWQAALAIRDGQSPYPEPIVSEVAVGNPALYPPLLMFVVLPLTILPWPVAAALWIGLLGLALVTALWVLDVRDPRCYLLVLVSAPAISGFIWGNATLLLVPMVALAWRWRNHPLRAGAMVGLALASKLFLWPLLFWLLGTRRYRALGVALSCATIAALLPWALLGFAGLTSYPGLLRLAEEVYGVHSFSTATLLSAAGLGTSHATRGASLLGLLAAAAALAVGRRRHDEAALSVAVVAAIAGSPIVWEHYYALVIIPVGIYSPLFSSAWVALSLFALTQRLPRPVLPASELDVGGIACCRPDDVLLASWVQIHTPPLVWPSLGHAALAGFLVLFLAISKLRSSGMRSSRRLRGEVVRTIARE